MQVWHCYDDSFGGCWAGLFLGREDGVCGRGVGRGMAGDEEGFVGAAPEAVDLAERQG